MKLTIFILSGNRYDLLSATIQSLLNTITIKDWDLVVYNHQDTIGKGWNDLMKRISGDFVLGCQDDWFFTEKWDWVEKSIKILEDNKDIGIFRFRKDGDGQLKENVLEEHKDFCIVDCVAGGFTLNPFIARKETILKLGKAPEPKVKGLAEVELRNMYKLLNLKTAKLNNFDKGVCIHIGRGRRLLKGK